MKKIKSLYGYGIYQMSAKELAQAEKDGITVSEYQVFLPDETPSTGYAEFECESMKECIENIGGTAERAERKRILGF